jgi:hypothetical protein
MPVRSSRHRAYPVQREGLHLPFVHSAATPYVRRCVRTVGSVMFHHSRSSPPLPQRSSLRSGFFCPSPSTLKTTSSVPLGGTSRFRRLAAYTECLRCAGAPRRPPSGSELSLMLFHNMSSSETTGNSSAALSQLLHRKHWPSTWAKKFRHSLYPHTPILVRCAFSRLDYGSLSLRPVALLALLSELTRLASSHRGRLHPGFRRFGHPPRRRISLQCQLGNLHWQDFHLLDHQLASLH